MVPQRSAPGLRLGSQLRPRSSGRTGHLPDGYRITTDRTINPRWRKKRLSVMVSGRAAHCVSIQPQRHGADLERARGWNAPAAAHAPGPEQPAQLEFQIGSLAGCTNTRVTF